MSRASGASFAEFFPSAPRAAKNKAKERERAKTRNSGSPQVSLAADTESLAFNSRAEDASLGRKDREVDIPATDIPPPQVEENEFVPGDILNGVGSASSHTSTGSSTFSAPPPSAMSNFTGSRNVSSLTPLTNLDSSPRYTSSPNRSKAVASASRLAEDSSSYNAEQARSATIDMINETPRIFARDPNKGMKGKKCIYDPLLDRKLSSNDKKKAKPIYKEFGLVRTHTHSAGGVIFCLKCLADNFEGR